MPSTQAGRDLSYFRLYFLGTFMFCQVCFSEPLIFQLTLFSRSTCSQSLMFPDHCRLTKSHYLWGGRVQTVGTVVYMPLRTPPFYSRILGSSLISVCLPNFLLLCTLAGSGDEDFSHQCRRQVAFLPSSFSLVQT